MKRSFAGEEDRIWIPSKKKKKRKNASTGPSKAKLEKKLSARGEKAGCGFTKKSWLRILTQKVRFQNKRL